MLLNHLAKQKPISIFVNSWDLIKTQRLIPNQTKPNQCLIITSVNYKSCFNWMTNRTEWQMPSQQQTDLVTNETGCKLRASLSLWNPVLPLLWIISGNCFSPCWGLFIMKFCFLFEAMKIENEDSVRTSIPESFFLQWHALNMWNQHKVRSQPGGFVFPDSYWNQIEGKIQVSDVSTLRRQTFIKSL